MVGSSKLYRIIQLFFISIVLLLQSSLSFGESTKWNDSLLDFAAQSYIAGNLKLPAKDSKSITCMSKAIFFEARGESKAGKRMVANVISNRVKHKEAFANTICGVVYQHKQFSWTSDSWKRNSSFVHISDKYAQNDYESWFESVRMSLYFVLFKPKNTGNALYFGRDYANFKGLKYLGSIGNHKFFTNFKDT